MVTTHSCKLTEHQDTSQNIMGTTGLALATKITVPFSRGLAVQRLMPL